MGSEACPRCKYAPICLTDPEFKRNVVRCTVCGRFRCYDLFGNKVTELDVLPCLHVQRARKTSCSKCKPGQYHQFVRFVFLRKGEALIAALDSELLSTVSALERR